jgi:hypothetical protein
MRLSRLFVLSFVILGACAGDVGDIDRTQPGKIRKSALDGEWYYRQTIVDLPYTAGITFIGEQSWYLERIKWEISEDFLTGYRSYERVTGTDIPSTPEGQVYQGAPLAAFKITKQFDVVRRYSEATGEQQNVIEENDVDRPWYEREYMRVDWSQNLIANFEFLAGGEAGLGVISQASSYAVTDPNDPDAPVFATRSGDAWTDYRDPMDWGTLERADYFDLTHKLQVTPETFTIWYDDYTTEQWPACWFYDEGPWDCASSTIKLRASFMRVPGSDYEPLYYPDNYVARDGDNKAIRRIYDYDLGDYRRCLPEEDQGCTTVRVPMLDWFGFFRTERETYDQDYGLTEEGRTYLANRFNIWEKSRTSSGTRISPSARTVKPITFYLSENFPSRMVPAANQVAGWWNEAFQATVSSLKGGYDGDVFKIKKNTYAASGGEITDYGQRNGDLRYSHLYWVDKPSYYGLLGYGPSSADPLTGEIITGDAYVYGAPIDEYGTEIADIIDLMRGEILAHEFIDGENVGRVVANLGKGPSQSSAEMRQRAGSMMDKGLRSQLQQVRQKGKNAYKRSYDYASARLQLADEDPRFAGLWNQEMQLAFEQKLGRRLSPSETPARIARARIRHRRELAKRAVDFVAFNDQSVLYQFERLKDLPREEILDLVRADYFKSTAAHEIGHTLGLRHNFAGSTDALNYHDAYWNIRDPNAQALDLPTDAEATAGLRDVAYSSIMDYSAKWNSDIIGIGKYDRAAIKFGYGQLVEAFVTPPDTDPGDDDPSDILNYFYTYYDSFNLDDLVLNWMHYTSLPKFFASSSSSVDGVINMRDRYDVPMEDIVDWMKLEPGADDFLYSLVPYRFCSDEYVSSEWFCDMWDEGADSYEIVNHATQTWRDYYIFRAFKRNQRYVDPISYYYGVYERTMLPLATQYQFWIFDQWYKDGEWSGIYDWEQDYIAERTTAGDPVGSTEAANADWNLDPNGGLAATSAALTGVNFLAEVLGTPEPGSYFTYPDEPNVHYWYSNREDPLCEIGEDSWNYFCTDIYVPVGDGRYAYSEFDGASGYYWYERIRVVGSFWDKLAAIETLADPTTYFLGVDDVADYSTYVIGFNAAFPHAVSALFGGVINDDYRYYAPTVTPEGGLEMPRTFEMATEAAGDTPAPALAARTGPFVDPATNFTVSLYTLFYGMAWLNSNFDQTFNDNAKIWIDGSGEEFTPQSGSTVAEFINPFNGRKYMARKSNDTFTYSLGYEMVTRAEAIRASIAAIDPTCFSAAINDPDCVTVSNQMWTLQNLIENMEVVRGYYDVYGYAWW